MQRLAWFTTLAVGSCGPPSGHSELIQRLREYYRIDVFTDALQPLSVSGLSDVFTAHDFVWKHSLRPYELTVYEIADTPQHDFMWPYLVRYPGLVVLHDDRLHRLRGSALRRHRRAGAYRAEFRYCHPGASPAIPEFGLVGHLGLTGDLWPMRRILLDCGRLVVVDSQWRAETLRDEASHDRFKVVRPGVPQSVSRQEDRPKLRASLGIPNAAVVFASFGTIGPRRRTPQILEAVSAIGRPDVHVLLCGRVEPGYQPASDAHAFGISDRFSLVADVDDRQGLPYLAAADVTLCLEWPDGCEATTPWLQGLAHGLPTVVTDGPDRVEIPTLDPRDWLVRSTTVPDSGASPQPPEPVSVSIDIVDESHSLRLALRRLATDDGLRTDLGLAGRSLWSKYFGLDQMVRNYRETFEDAMAVPLSDAHPDDLPPHLVEDGTTHLRSLLGSLGVKYPLGPQDQAEP